MKSAPMQKSDAVAAMGPSARLLPAWIKAALAANDRLKLYLTVLQAAAAHADHPETEPLDLARDAATGPDGRWLRELPAASSRLNGTFHIPGLPRPTQRLAENLGLMARPLLEARGKDEDFCVRVQHWADWLSTIGGKKAGGEALTSDELRLLTAGTADATRGREHDRHDFGADTFHLLVMDLHKQLNQLAASLSHPRLCGRQVANPQEPEAIRLWERHSRPLRQGKPWPSPAITE